MKKIKLLAGLSMLLLVAMVAPVTGQVTVGIEVGDWFLYKGTLVSWVADEGVTFPPNQFVQFLQTYNTSDWMNYTVIDITPGDGGANVTFSVLTHWSDGTETTETLVDNVTSSFTMMVIGANLAEGYEIRPEVDWSDFFGFPYVWPPRILEAPIMLVTDNGTRETNVLNFTHPPDLGYTRQMYYWDNSTGIQVYYETESSGTMMGGGDYSYFAKFELINSKSGVIVPDLTGPILLLTIMLITIPIVLLHRRKKQPSKTLSLSFF